MKPVLDTLIIKRFRSIPTECIAFENPTFLVGRNGSGKSNVVDALSFLAEAMTLPLQAVFDGRGGISVVRNLSSGRSAPPNLGFCVKLGALNGEVQRARYAFEVKALKSYGFEVIREQCIVEAGDGRRHWFDRKKRAFRSSVPGLEPALEPAALGLPVVGGETRFSPVLRTLASMKAYSVEPAKLRQMQDPDSGISLKADGSNAASVLQEIERHSADDVATICEILETIVPGTKKVKTIKHGNKLSLKFTQEWGQRKRPNFESFNMSDGTLRILGLLMAVYQRPTPALVAIEEPEATIHPGAIGAVLDLLRHASRHMQLVVTTHSPEVLDAAWISDDHLRMVTWEEGATRISRVSEVSRRALREHLMGAGELLRSNALAPAPPLFDEDASQRDLFEEF